MAVGRHIANMFGLVISLTLPLSVSGSVPELDTAGLFTGPKQRASFHAIMDYQACLRSAASALRLETHGKPSDEQVRNLGFACPTELDRVARALVVRSDWNIGDESYWRLSRPHRIESIKKYFASDAWCEFRDCRITD